MEQYSDIGLIGLAVMGQNLVLNINDNGYSVSVYNRTHEKTKSFIKNNSDRKTIYGFDDVSSFIDSLKSPKLIIMMIKSGKPVDDLIEELIPLLKGNDILIDGGNSYYKDTERREIYSSTFGIQYLGVGISGGEEGARFGPSIMPGGNIGAWNIVKKILFDISAKIEEEPCCAFIGRGGSGHYVKMVHNGIEYGDMQLISEIYNIMKVGMNIPNPEMSKIFNNWNNGKLNSYLIEITSKILNHKDENGSFVVDSILDKAEQKGTGRWTAISSLEFGIPLNLITESVYQRSISSLKSLRTNLSQLYTEDTGKLEQNDDIIIHLQNALYVSKIISYSQGFHLLREASENYKWNLKFDEIASIWRGGCIIRSGFLSKISDSYKENPELVHLFSSSKFYNEILNNIESLRLIVTTAINLRIPVPGLCSALMYFESIKSKKLPANLIQAQRDFFGAHGYQDLSTLIYTHTKWY
ncbi:MAG: decarboxylating NADP(+)-dependent phosphogluconate dehydrogenase [Candidatus Heimdallarchaeota archaeon]|nr:decarboxylating NADP(+)-dependent phosphogluconate dehydrogenase [Candidatus Heimdallarchaeota archaeon]